MAGLSRHLAAAARRLPERLRVPAGRAYGSSAGAALCDYYSEEEEELGGPREAAGPPPRAGSQKLVPERGVQWVVMGDRGAKKHVYAEMLAKLLEVPHISMGSLVRQELNPRSSLYKQIASALNERKLVPEEVIFALLSRRLEEGYYRGETGFILEGIPRTRVQAEILNQFADIDLVLNFKSTEQDPLAKNLGTGAFPPSLDSTNLHLPGSKPGLRSSGEQLVSADVNSAWKENLTVYAEQTKLLEEYYQKQKKLLNFQVASAPGETWRGLLVALQLQHVNAVDSSQKLTA
ncbi:probable adenylate kinase 7, mitochondrial [Eucalyptus grandis]|uniref:probable adenylate kinase 7, mitochondrial n=1 Tax=Eucalyptus grandis TaxID=71139 RepID=UPI00192F0BCD|nr:probable adenylate kinase 7, mitochondrial [Eucalyptus grandis]